MAPGGCEAAAVAGTKYITVLSFNKVKLINVFSFSLRSISKMFSSSLIIRFQCDVIEDHPETALKVLN